MSELHNGQSQIQCAPSKPKGKYTGERIPEGKIQAIINALSLGEPVDRIARRLKTSKHTIIANARLRNQTVQRSSRRRSDFRCAAIRSAVVWRAECSQQRS